MLCKFFIDFPVKGDNTSECAYDVTFVGLAIRLADIVIDCAATGIEVFNDDGGGLIEFLDQFERSVGVHEVVEADGLAAFD